MYIAVYKYVGSAIHIACAAVSHEHVPPDLYGNCGVVVVARSESVTTAWCRAGIKCDATGK